MNDWKSKLAPVLEEQVCPPFCSSSSFHTYSIKQESHKNFDILEYGETLIHTLRGEYEGKAGVVIHEEGGVEANSDLVVPFSKLTVNTERYEVARRFTAMLQLVRLLPI